MSAEQRLLMFIGTLPPTVNPYRATANKLEEEISTPPSPLWSRRLRIIVFVLYVIIMFQSVFLLYLRTKVHQSFKLEYTKLGLLVINLSDSSPLAYLLSVPFTLYVLLVQIGLDRGWKIDQALLLSIFGSKFIPILLGSWSLLWVSACQCAQLFWESNMAHGLNREKLRFAIKWGLSIFFVVAAFFPCPFIIWIYILAYQDCHEIESTIHHIAARLRAKGRHYDPNHFNTFDLLKLLIPAQKLAPVVERLRHLIDGSTYLYFVIVCLLISVYFPLLAISLRALYKQSVSQSTIDAAMGTITNGASQPSRTGKRIHRERQRLVYHSMCVFISTVVHLPPLAWKVFHSKGDYLHDVTWNEVTRHGLVSPLAFSGNVILFILNMHSYQILVDRRMRLQHASFSVGSTREGTPYKKSTLGTLFLGDDDEDDISPSTSALEAQKEDTEKYDSSANSSEPINRYLMGGIKIQQCTFSKAS